MKEDTTSSDPVIGPSAQPVDVEMPEDDLSIESGDVLEASSDPFIGPNTQPVDVEMDEYVPSIEGEPQSLTYLNGCSCGCVARKSAHNSSVTQVCS